MHEQEGECRFNPPSVVGSWPAVTSGQWCGKWEPGGDPLAKKACGNCRFFEREVQ